MKKTYAKPMAEKFEFDYSEVVATSVGMTDYDTPGYYVCKTRINDGAVVCYPDNLDQGSNAYWVCHEKG